MSLSLIGGGVVEAGYRSLCCPHLGMECNGEKCADGTKAVRYSQSSREWESDSLLLHLLLADWRWPLIFLKSEADVCVVYVLSLIL